MVKNQKSELELEAVPVLYEQNEEKAAQFWKIFAFLLAKII